MHCEGYTYMYMYMYIVYYAKKLVHYVCESWLKAGRVSNEFHCFVMCMDLDNLLLHKSCGRGTHTLYCI